MTMKTLIALSLFVAVVSAGVLPVEKKLPRMKLYGKSRITNGEVAARGQFPYQVGLSLAIGEGSAWCGGTLISDRWILTAAHCTNDVDSVVVYLGALNIKDENEKGQQRVFVSKSHIVIHPEYDPNRNANDISLIRLPFPIEFNNLIQPAALPKKNGKYSTYEGESVWATGWGKESDSSNTVSPWLRFIEVPVMKQSSCNAYYFGQITKSMICIKTTGRKSVCNGDSGGPLVFKENGVNTVIGATSFGIVLGCEKGWPGVFTRVTEYLDWIEKVSGVVNT